MLPLPCWAVLSGIAGGAPNLRSLRPTWAALKPRALPTGDQLWWAFLCNSSRIPDFAGGVRADVPTGCQIPENSPLARGAADTVFFLKIEQTGAYFLRLLWFEGTGGAPAKSGSPFNAAGQRALVNGTEPEP